METLKIKTLSNISSGLIENEDFSTSYPNKKRINNHVNAIRLEYSLNEYKKVKKMERKYKNMTLEELREMKLISNTNGRPTSTLTDEKWQKEFNVRKLFITPVSKDIKKLGKKYSHESGFWNEEIRGIYDGTTNWQVYCSYINDVLNNIRAGQIDCCYYIYQILDLLKFHPHNLKTKYRDGYWNVWLDR